MIVEEHPTAAQLTAFGLGKLDDAEFTAIEAHVAECETCRRHLETQAADSFVALARAVRSEHTSPDAAAIPPAPCAPTCAHTDSAAPASTEVPQELADHPRYRILGLIGVGGMGAVFKAEHLLMQRVVALKMINRRLVANPALVERFTREVIAAGSLSHPNIVHYHDAEHIGDTHFLVMEHVEGINLAKLMAEIGPLPIAQACDYVRQAALGLQHAFERGMVHRDIKPQNLMVARVRSQESGGRSQESGQPVVKILDFGLARLAQETEPTPVEPMAETRADQGRDTPSGTLTQIGTVMGTPDYIAPEQARDAHAADIRSDIYSLGCTLYDLLTGNPPFAQGTVMQKVIAHLEQMPRPVTELRPEVPVELAKVIEKMLAKDPAQRYQTPAEVAAALAPFARSDPEAPARVGAALASASGSGRRRRWGWAVAGAALFVVIASLFLPPVQDYAQTVIRIATNKGVLEIEADDEDVEITIKQAGKEPRIEMVDRKTRKTFELTAVGGDLVFREKGGDLRLTSTKFELGRGDRKLIRAGLLLAKVKTDRELIQGTWKPVRVEVKGMPVPDLVFQTLDPHITIKGTQVVWKLGQNMLLPNIEGEIMLDPSKSPKTINMIVFDKANRERKVLLGIYKLEGDTLEICSVLNPDEPADRPKDFKSDAKGFVGHIVLQRAKAIVVSKEPAFQPLFNGKDLTGWKMAKATWTVKDGAIIADGAGELVSERVMAKDFRLRMEVKLKRGAGVIRFRIPASGERDWNLALLDNRLGTMDAMLHTGRGQITSGLIPKVANLDEWITLEIAAQDKEATVRINGKQALYLHDDKYTPAPGRVGLLIVGTTDPEATELHVRKIEILEFTPGPPPPGPAFQPLFNGKNLDGWTGPSDSYFVKKDGSLLANPVPNEYSMLRTSKSYENYELRMQCKVANEGQAFAKNRGGVALHVYDEMDLTYPSYALGISLTSGRAPDIKLHAIGKFGEVKEAQRTKGAGADGWHDLRIACEGKKVTIFYDGEERWSCTDCPKSKGNIGLWSTDGEAYFRNIEIREMPIVAPKSDFRPLFDGKDASNWDMALADNWRFEDNRLICRGRGGMLRPRNLTLHEFHLRIEARTFGDGTFLRVGPQLFKTPTQKSVTAHQHVMLFANGAVAAGTIGMEFGGNNFTGAAQKDRTKAGEWFTLEVINDGRYVRTLIDGEQAAEFVNTEPAALIGLGLLGFNVEDRNGELQIRKVEIKELVGTPVVDAKRIQGAWTAYQGTRVENDKTKKLAGDELKSYALKFEGEKLKSDLFAEASFRLSAPDQITIKWSGPNKQVESVTGMYRLQFDLLSLDLPEVALPADPKTKKPLQIALMRFHNELQPLFNGRNLDGFANDRQAWMWQKGSLIGVQRAADKDAHWLFRPSFPDLRDFELEFDARLNGEAKVGILFRGGANKERSGLRMNGPILTIGGAAPGGLWSNQLNQMFKTPAAEKIKNVKANDFNHYLLRCVGKRVIVQVNGVATVDGEIDVPHMHREGNLAWMLLGDGKAATVTFRDIKIRLLE